MTYCAGWKYKDTVFLLADSAATKITRPITSHSSFGELHAEVRGEHVEESLLKIVPIGAGTVAAYAGDVQFAANYLSFLRDGLPTAKSISDLLQSLTLSMGPFDPERVVALLLASSTNGGSHELTRWSTEHGTDLGGADYYQIGSLTSYHSALTPALLSKLAAGNVDTARMLVIATAIVQSYGIHDSMIDMNVGGLVFGAQTSLGVVNWQGDTNYVLYNAAFTSHALVTAIARDNTLVVTSSLTDSMRVFGHSASMPGTSIWDEQWLRRVKEELDSGLSPNWIFISTTGKIITLVFRQDIHKESKYIKLTNLGSGKFDLAVSHELMSTLVQPLQDRSDGSLPFRLNVRSD
jgi:hypothetical protein